MSINANLAARAAAQPHVLDANWPSFVGESTRLLLASGEPYQLAQYDHNGLASTPEGVDVWVIEDDNGLVSLDPACLAKENDQ